MENLIETQTYSNGVEIVPFYLLSPRKQQIVQLTADGNTHREIADILGLSEKSVETHKDGIKTDSSRFNERALRRTMMAQIIDGISRGHLIHEIPEGISVKSISYSEQRVLSELASGLTQEEIGNKLFLSKKTIENHITRIFKKLGVRNSYQAVARSIYLGKILKESTYAHI